MPAGSSGSFVPPNNRLAQNAVLTLLLVVMGLALLYAYRSQTPAIPTVSLTQAIQDVNAGRIRAVTISGSVATLEFREGGAKEQATVPQPDTVLSRAIQDYNAAHPSQPVDLRFAPESAVVPTIASVFLSVLPVLLIGGFFFYMMRTRRAP